jgi:hypothetical protein
MNATLSTRQLRLVALLVGIVVIAAGYLVVSKHKSTSPSTANSTPATTTPAGSTPTQSTPSPSKTHTHTATPVKLDTHGLPVPVALALLKHSIVVVSLSTPRGADDEFTTAEAKAAALEMHAGYIDLNVYRQRPGTAILRRLGVVSTPATLIVKRPGAVYSNFKGFVDRDVVAQAIADARS